MPSADSEPAGDWLEHVDWDDLVGGAITLLDTARSALIYLARTAAPGEATGGPRPRLRFSVWDGLAAF